MPLDFDEDFAESVDNFGHLNNIKPSNMWA
jgi:hypothetical protein